MTILTTCKKNIIVEAIAKLFFEWVWVYFTVLQTIISNQDSRFLRTFWLILWSLMDTKLIKSTSFHPQNDGQMKVVNRMIMHILCMYNSKHPCTWYQSLPYVQHGYNRAFDNSTGNNLYQMCLVFQPLGPVDVALPLATIQIETVHVQFKAHKATNFTERIQYICQQVHNML